MKRSHHCAQLTNSDLGATVALLGWVDSIRDHGGIIFIDLRDRKGLTQVKFDPKDNAALGTAAAHLKPESVIAVAGLVLSVVAAFYYLRIVKTMWFDPPVGEVDASPRDAKAVAIAAALFSFPVVLVALGALDSVATAAAATLGVR